MKLSAEQQKILDSYSPDMHRRAIAALSEGYAFCAACAAVGMMNCGYFDECGGAVFPEKEKGKKL